MFKNRIQIILTISLITLISCFSVAYGRDQAALNQKLSYLADINEISWVEIDENNVYVGFNKIPSDFSTIVRGAAVQGNRAYGFGVHAWAVNAKNTNWRPGSGPYYCEATARHGKIEKSDCK